MACKMHLPLELDLSVLITIAFICRLWASVLVNDFQEFNEVIRMLKSISF